MWIGTENGLNRYDGHRFTIYRPGQEKHLVSNEFVTGIAQDESGRIWVATKNGLNRIDTETDSLTVFLPQPGSMHNPGKSLPNNLLWGLHLDQNKLWLAIDNRDLCYLDTRNDTFFYFPWKQYVATRFPKHANEYRAIQAIKPGYPNGYWLGTNMGLFGFDTLSRQFEYLGGIFREDVQLLQPGTDFHGAPLVVFRQETGNGSIYQPESGYAPMAARKLQEPFLPRPARLNLWINTDTKLLRYDHAQNRLINTELALTEKLTAPKIKNTYYDAAQHCHWLATDQGFYVYSDFLNLFPFTYVAAERDEAPPVIRNALMTDDSTVWLADANGGLIIQKNSVPPVYIRQINGKPLKETNFIFRDTHNKIWILSRHHLYQYDEKTKRFSETTPPFPEPKVYMVMREDADQNLWVGTLNMGVYRWKRNENKWEKLSDPANSVPFYVRDVLLDINKRHVWIATFNQGLVRYDIATQRYEYFSKDSAPANGLLSSTITSLAQNSDGTLWVGTEWGGVSRFRETKNEPLKFTTFTTAHGLAENRVNSLLASTDGGVWVTTAKGLAYLTSQGEVAHQWISSNQSVLKPIQALLHSDPDRGFLFPVETGYMQAKWPLKNEETIRYPLILNEMSVNGELLAEPASRLPYNKNQISFSFQLLRYDSPSDVYYDYTLDGLENDWVREAGIIAGASFFNLPAGEFTFRVRATDALGNILSEELQHSFTITKPVWMWWQLWTFAALLAACGIYLLWLRLTNKLADEKIINYFATSLYGRNTVDDVFWDIAKNCIGQLGFEDCVIYQYDENKQILIQKAAFGPKNPEKYEILNPLTIPIGQGITGYAALHGRHVLVSDTSKDSRYILDDQQRYSELAVPIFIEGRVFGVIDSEHSQKNFYTKRHVRILRKIADLCNQKLIRYLTEEKLRTSIARDLHDEIGSTLTSINIISKIAIEQHNPEKVYDYLGRIKENSRVTMDAMSDMVWAINPENDSLNRMIIRLKEFSAEILDPAGIAYVFEVDPALAETRLNLSSRKDLYLIIKEAITNAAKYSKANKVLIQFESNADAVTIRIEDDGVGMEPTADQHGNGLKNMRHRAQLIKSTLSIRSADNQGTSIVVKIPIT